jgi:hypothetical protein
VAAYSSTPKALHIPKRAFQRTTNQRVETFPFIAPSDPSKADRKGQLAEVKRAKGRKHFR